MPDIKHVQINNQIRNIAPGAVDSTPTENSTNPVSSGGVYTALGNKQNTLTFDSTPTASSTNPVTSDGTKSYVDNSISDEVTRANGAYYAKDSFYTDIIPDGLCHNNFYREKGERNKKNKVKIVGGEVVNEGEEMLPLEIIAKLQVQKKKDEEKIIKEKEAQEKAKQQAELTKIPLLEVKEYEDKINNKPTK